MRLLWSLLKKIAHLISGPKTKPESLSAVPVVEGPDVKFKNDSERLQYEWEELREKNYILVEIVEKIADFTGHTLGKDVMITMIGRTNDEQDNIYAGTTRSDGRSYDEKPWKSPHQFDHAVDIRSRTFTKEESEYIEQFINSEYDTENYYRWTAKNHTVYKEDGTSLGAHFHIQYYKI